jgi:spore germination protein GerM
MRASAAIVFVAFMAAGCTRHPSVSQPHQITVYYCQAGSDKLMPVQFSIDPKLQGSAAQKYALNQLLVGPTVGRDAVVLFPQGTQASLSRQGKTAVVDLTGTIAKSFQGGATDEAAMFKSLTYTLTAFPDITGVQVLVGGQKVAALPGGHFELDEPLTKDTFAQ